MNSPATRVALVEAIIFDLDDTLYPEHEYVLSGFRAVSRAVENSVGLPAREVFAELERLYLNGVRGDTFDRWLSKRGLSSLLSPSQMINWYRDHAPDLRLFPDAMKVLSALHGKVKLGVVTDGHLTVQQQKVAALGVGGLFHGIVYSDELGRQHWKPSTRPFEAILQRLRVPADRAAYVGDNVTKDFLGPRQLGMLTIRVRRPNGEYADRTPPTVEHDGHATIESLDDLLGALAEVSRNLSRA